MKLLQTARRRIGGAVRVLGLALSGDYKAASTQGRLRGFQPSGRGPNATLLGNLDLLRRRSRQLVRENCYGASAIERFVSTTIGTGIVPISQHPNAETKKKIQDLFLAWTDECDASGTCDFYGLQSQVCRAERQDGEVFVRLRPRRAADGLKIPLQLQVIESDFCPIEHADSDNETTRAGIVFDAIGKRKAYRMYRDHPGEMFGLGSATISTVPANQILHVYRVKRPGQLRGEPWLTPAIVLLYDIEQYTDAMLLRAKLSNLLAFFVKKSNEEDTPGTFNEEDQGDGTALGSLEPGSVNYLDPGEDIEIKTPVEPGTTAPEFLKLLLRAVAGALGGLTHEQLTGNLEGVNLSSIRAGMMEARRWCEAYQHQVMVFQFCRQVWKAWMEAAVLAGLIDAGEYAAHPEWYGAVWHPHRWPWTEPLKDLEAAVGMVRAGFSDRDAEVAKLGDDAQRIDEANAKANQRADAAGLRYDSDGRVAKNAAATPPAPEPDEAPDAKDEKNKGTEK